MRLQVAGVMEAGDYAFPLTQVELADTLGLSNVHVNRQMKKLKQDGLVEWSRGRLRVPDVYRLENFAGFKADYLQLR